MKQNKMAICDHDKNYVYRLQEALGARASFPFTVSVYTDEQVFLQEYKRQKYAMVLAGETCYQALCDGGVSGGLILLKENGDTGSAAHSIRKYQSGEQIRRQLMELYAAAEQHPELPQSGGKKTKIIGIFSPICREIQTSFSLLMGQFLAKKSGVLYLNFEPFSGLSKLLEGANDRDLTDLVYYMEGGRERLVYKLESMVGNVNGLDYISPAFSFIDLGQIDAESWLLLLETLKEIGTYDYIILDLSELVKGLLDVLRACDMIYTIANREGMALSRMEQYEDLLRHLEYEDILTQASRCELPVFKKLPSSIEELPYTDLAGYVKRIVEEEVGA